MFLHCVLFALLDRLLIFRQRKTGSRRGNRTKIRESVHVKEIFHVGFLVEEHDMGCQPSASDAEVNVAVVSLRGLVLRVEPFEEQIAAFGRLACTRNREIINEETKYAVVVCVCLVDETTWVGW